MWAKQNKGLKGRQAKDEIVHEEDVSTARGDPNRIKEQLERKAAIYDKIRCVFLPPVFLPLTLRHGCSKGKTGGLNEDQIGSLLVDFDRKAYDNPDTSDDDSEVDESATVPNRLLANDDEVRSSSPFRRPD